MQDKQCICLKSIVTQYKTIDENMFCNIIFLLLFALQLYILTLLIYLLCGMYCILHYNKKYLFDISSLLLLVIRN